MYQNFSFTKTNFFFNNLGKVVTTGSSTERVQVTNLTQVLANLAKPFNNLQATHSQLNIQQNKQTKYDVLQKIDNLVEYTTSHGHTYRHHNNRFIRLHRNGQPKLKDPILVLGTDGVGTKLKIAQIINKNDTVGIDLVAMCVNDTLCNGAEPLSFLDYYACGKIDEQTVENVVSGVVDGCKQSTSCLVSGKLVEVKHLYQEGEYDLAGFALGVVENGLLLPRINEINDGDAVIGLPSSGVHSNGFSLVHKVMEIANVKFHNVAPFSASGKTFGKYNFTNRLKNVKT